MISLSKSFNLIRKFTILVLVLSFATTGMAKAGIATEMVEVGEEDREVLEQCLIGLEECVDEKEKLAGEAKDLKSRLGKLMSELTQQKEEKAKLKDKIASLKDNEKTLEDRIKDLKKQVSEKKVIEIVKEVPAKSSGVLKAKTEDDTTCVACKTVDVVGRGLGGIVATPVGAVVGTLRGATNKSIEYSNKGSKALGNNIPGQLIGKLGGGALGFVAGAVSGIFKGLFHGLWYGVSRPFSNKSFSTEGKFATEYDPYKIF